MNMSYKKSIILSSLLCITNIHASAVDFKVKAGLHISKLTMENIADQKVPFIQIDNPTYPILNGENGAANSAFFTNQQSVPKGSVDSVSFQQIMLGIQASMSDTAVWPSKEVVLRPVINAYVTSEPSSKSVLAGFYEVNPSYSFGGDFGIQFANNGNYAQLGLGGLLNRSNYKTGIMYAALDLVESTNDPDKTGFQSTDNEAYAADQSSFAPYIYSEISTEIGDIATAFIKVTYGLESTPDFTEETEGTQMFPGGEDTYASNQSWKYHSVSVGISSNMDLLLR